MKIITLILLVIFLFTFCEGGDHRLKLINQTKKTGLITFQIGPDDKLYFPDCKEFENYKKEFSTVKWLLANSDTTDLWTRGDWDIDLKSNNLLVYFIDSSKFEDYCKNLIPLDSTYKKYEFTNKDVIDNNWILTIKE